MSGRLLVVEDDPAIRSSLTMALEDEGYEVLAAADAEEGLVLLAQGSCDAVLVDLMLPGMDGFELTRRIRHGSGMPIMWSARGSAPAPQERISEGVGDVGVAVIGDALAGSDDPVEHVRGQVQVCGAELTLELLQRPGAHDRCGHCRVLQHEGTGRVVARAAARTRPAAGVGLEPTTKAELRWDAGPGPLRRAGSAR